MKLCLILSAILSLTAFTTACNRDNRIDDGMQREEDILSEDFREKDSYNRSIPTKDDEMELEREKLNMGPNESSVTE